MMVNAWELLLKAKILHDNNNKLKSLYVEDKSQKKANGEPYAHPKYKKNRADNYFTIDINKSANILSLDTRLLANIELLTEIRDNAIHFYNSSKLLEKKVLEVGTASLKSWVEMVTNWFNEDLSRYNFYLMPISFFHPYELESFSINNEAKQHQNLLRYIESKEEEYPSDPDKEHNISLKLQTKFVKSSDPLGLSVRYDGTDPKAIAFRQSAEQVFAGKYPWSFEDLLEKLKGRYTDLKQNSKLWEAKKMLEANEDLCGERYLDHRKRGSTKKKFYSPSILKEFDKHFTRC